MKVSNKKWKWITALKMWDLTNIWYEFKTNEIIKHDDRIFKDLKYD